MVPRLRNYLAVSLAGLLAMLAVGFLAVPGASAGGGPGVAGQVTYYNANYGGYFFRSPSPTTIQNSVYGIGQTINGDGSIYLTAGPHSQYTDSGFSIYHGTLGGLGSLLVTGTGPFAVNIWVDASGNGEFFDWSTPQTVDGNVYMTGLGGDVYFLGNATPTDGTLVINGSTTFYLEGATPPHGQYTYTLNDLLNGDLSSLNVSSSSQVAVWIGITGSTAGPGTQATINTVQFGPPSTVGVTAHCASAADGTAVSVNASTYYCGYNAFPTVQQGVYAVAPGGTVQVAPGTYTEQVTIDKAMTLTGAGEGQTTIDLPPSPQAVPSALSGHSTVYGIDVTAPASGVTISNLTVEGSSATNGVDGCQNGMAGIGFENASGTVDGVALPDWAPQSGVGCGSGQGVQVETGTNGTANVTVKNSAVTNYGKSGIFAGGAGAALTATGDTVTSSPTSGVATNGIEVDYGASGSVSGNTVSGNDYTGTVNSADPQADYAAGVLLYGDGANSVSVTGNTLTDNQIGVESVATNAVVSGNTISETGSGITDSIGVYAVPCDTYCADVGVATNGASQVTINDNTISGLPLNYTNYSNPAAQTAGIWVGNTAAASADGSMSATINDNTVSGGFSGIMVGPNSSGASATIKGNQVSGFERAGIDAGSYALGGDGVTATIEDNTVSGPGAQNTDQWASNGIEIANGATGSIVDNHISGMVYMRTDTEASAITVFESSNVQVSGNTLLDNQLGVAVQTAGYSADQTNWAMTGDVVENNTIKFDSNYTAPNVLAGESSGTWGIWVASYKSGASVQADIHGNVLLGAGAATAGIPSTGIEVGDTGVGGAVGTVSATITGNTVTGWSDGIADMGTTGATFSSTANYNDLSGNTAAGLANLTGAASGTTAVPGLDATDNWWGSASGPQSSLNTFNVASQGAAVSGGVAFVPWLSSAPAAGATSGQGFAPVTDTTSGQVFSSIQAAINAASSGDTIAASAGIYSEGVTVGKELTLEGAQQGVDARSRSGPESIITGVSGGPDVTVTTDNVTLDGFTLDGPSSPGTAAIVMIGANTGETIENNVIVDPGRAVSYTTSDTTFKQNLVDETSTTGDGIQENSGAVSGVTIEDNAFTGGSNNNADITFIGTTANHNKNIVVTDNTSTAPSTFLVLFNTDGATVTGNTVTGATGAAIYIGGGDSGVTVEHDNLVATSGSPKYAVVVSNIFGDGPNTSAAVNFNALYGLSVGTNAYSGGKVDATDNWWGSKNGPLGQTQGALNASPFIQALAISPPLIRAQIGSQLQWTASLVDENGNPLTDPAFTAALAASGSAACQNQSPTAPQPLSSAATFGCIPTNIGELTVTGTVSLDGTPTGLVGTAMAAIVPPPATGGSSGSSGSGGSGSNGNQSSTVTVAGSTTTFDVNPGDLVQSLNGATQTDVSFSSDTTTADVNLSADALQSLSQNGDGISIQTPGATYTLPSGSLDVGQLATLLGATQPSDISLSLSVTPASSSDTTDITQNVPNGTIVGAPMTFTITATVNGQTQTIEEFSGAVPRSFTLETAPDPSDTTGIVLVNGVPEHAWTVFSGTTATIYSHTDSTYAVLTHEASFNDIGGLPQAAAIQALANKLIIAGTTPTTFDPQGGVTRAQFAALVVRALGLWNLASNAQFGDVPSASWAAPVIRSAVAESFIEGYPDGTFRPQLQITNAQMAVIVGRVMDFLNIPAGQTVVTVSDQARIPAWATQDVALVLSQGIMTTGSQGAFQPDATTTRAQAAQIIWNLMQKAGIE